MGKGTHFIKLWVVVISKNKFKVTPIGTILSKIFDIKSTSVGVKLTTHITTIRMCSSTRSSPLVAKVLKKYKMALGFKDRESLNYQR